ncbi:MAG: uncharacterized protein QG602_4072 [Verrucomicrobiota bacterium]|nr:uncharacterized protein [Verrucomicrobiota bacterium]
MFSRAITLIALAMLTLAARAETSPLASSPSEFVRAQAASGVKWQVWDAATLAQAKQQNKSIYVFIGSPLSELTRATINQTFTSEKTVAWLNENFFCLFVDADAQPDVAALGQHFITTVKQLKGSPVHLWLTPDTLQPYDGANYLPPSEEWGKPGFLKAARAALDTWTVDPARARALATEALDMMRLPPVDTNAPLDIEAKLAAAAKAWVAAADPVNGGFGTAPKLPEPELIRFLLTRGDEAREAAIKAARALVNGALRDPVDGGFYRRCIDEAWKEPYFQKTLADQARIALALLDAADAAKDDKLRAAGIAALDFALKELRNPNGSLAAALDGTLEENSDPTKRPTFVKAGVAGGGTVCQLIMAIYKSGQKRLTAQIQKIADGAIPAVGVEPLYLLQSHSVATATEPTPADLLHAVLMGKVGGEESKPIGEMIVMANLTYFEPETGVYMATPKKLPPGIAARVPASGETPSAEVLALLAGVDAKTADLIRRNLMHQIEYDELPPGDILLGLSQTQK